MPPAPGHAGMPRVTAGKLIGHIITIPTHPLWKPDQSRRNGELQHPICNSDDPAAAWFVVAEGLCLRRHVCIPRPCAAKVSDSRWGCGPIKCRLFGLMNVPVWWAWREAQVSRGNVLPTAVAVNKCKHTEERSAVPQHSVEAVCLCPISKTLRLSHLSLPLSVHSAAL